MPALGQKNPAWETSKNPRSHLWTPKIHTLCAFCGLGIITTEYRKKKGMGKYCSRACQTNARKGIPSTKAGGLRTLCAVCGTTIETQAARLKAGRGKFCSKQCAGKHHAENDPNFVKRGIKRPEMSGDKHPAWKGGVTAECQTIRMSMEYKIWRKAVLERDFYACTACGSTDRLHAHHILRFIDFPHKRFDITNGITLCLPCHWKLHGKNERRKK